MLRWILGAALLTGCPLFAICPLPISQNCSDSACIERNNQEQQTYTNCLENERRLSVLEDAQTPRPVSSNGGLLGAAIRSSQHNREYKKAVKWCAAHPGQEHGYAFSDGSHATCEAGEVHYVPRGAQ